MKDHKPCIMDNCDRAAYYKGSQLCTACYSALYYWKRKSVTEIVKRKNNLKKFLSRMDIVEPKVVTMPTRKRKAG
jgi:Zn-finger protein